MSDIQIKSAVEAELMSLMLVPPAKANTVINIRLIPRSMRLSATAYLLKLIG